MRTLAAFHLFNFHSLFGRKWFGYCSAVNNKRTPFGSVLLLLAAEPGFEPRMTESEAGVLPLHYSAGLPRQPFTFVYFSTQCCVCQVFLLNLCKKVIIFFLSLTYSCYPLPFLIFRLHSRVKCVIIDIRL